MMTGQITATIEARDLEAIDNIIYEPKTEELTARSVFPQKYDVNEGAESYSYDVMTRSGAAKVIANGADDLPLVDVDMVRKSVPIYSIGVGLSYTVQDLRAARMQGTTVDAAKAATVRRAIAEKENSIAFRGEKKYAIKGAFEATGIQVDTSPTNGEGGASSWAKKTAEQIIDEIGEAHTKITVLPGYGTASLKLCLPPKQYELINKKRYSNEDSRSVLKVLQDNAWFSAIVRVPDLVGIGTADSDSFAVIHDSNETAELIIPMDITRHPEEYAFPRTKVPFEERTAGVVVRFPSAIVRVDGI